MKLTEEQKRKIWLAVYDAAVIQEATQEEFFEAVEKALTDSNRLPL
tara:strand:- start:709 stop:846 length:138 start_codon:yes stop_codon:yes gene_type:complete